jgi:tetratricopeptide (TPR) repeat protein
LDVVGESHRQDALWRIVGRRPGGEDGVRFDVHAVLVREPDNAHDPNAIGVWIDGFQVGYLSRSDAARYHSGLVALEQRYGTQIALSGVIAGGGRRDDGPGMLGVFLRHSPVDFGLSAPPPRRSAEWQMDTGLTDALASDAQDDSYDLAWLDRLPEDPIRAIAALRKLLAHEPDPIDRHFMFHHLGKALYRCRDVFDSALHKYDACCAAHDAEMDTIRAAFLAKWGKVPAVHMYKQACIRHAKARDYQQALRWAERGLAVYGEQAARPDAVEDLRKRAASYRTKLASASLTKPSNRPRTGTPPRAEIEILTCVLCGSEFERTPTFGRKPTRCRSCRA